jgi:hypothetical protein
LVRSLKWTLKYTYITKIKVTELCANVKAIFAQTTASMGETGLNRRGSRMVLRTRLHRPD